VDPTQPKQIAKLKLKLEDFVASYCNLNRQKEHCNTGFSMFLVAPFPLLLTNLIAAPLWLMDACLPSCFVDEDCENCEVFLRNA
jgi:hypothetical protein